jgi:two-component system sensor histidine kinase/response regulator
MNHRGGSGATGVRLDDQARAIAEANARAAEMLARLEEVNAQLEQAQEALKEANSELERRVEQRTAALRANEEKYRNVVENANEAIIVLQDGKVKFANPRASELTGFTLDEFKNNSFVELIHPDDRQVGIESYQRRLKGEQFESVYPLRLIVKDGRTLWVEARAALINWEGRPAVLDFLTDITKRKQAVAALCASEERLRTITGAAKDAIMMMDDSGRVTFWNPAAEAMFGYAANEVLGRKLHGFLAPERFRAAHAAAFARFLATGEGAAVGKTVELPAARKDGSEVPVELSLSALQIDGRWHAVGVSRDITERKQAETALREMNAYLDNLITHANAPIIVWDPNFRITRFNRAFERLTGRKESDVKGQTLDILFPASQREDSLSLIRRTATGERWETVEIPIQHVDGSVFTVLWNSATLYTPDGSVLATIAQGQDITARKQAEDALARKSTELAALDEQKNQFLGMAAHDLRNPMAVILNYCEFILGGYVGTVTPEQAKFISTMKRSSEFMLKLVNDLLDVSKIEAGSVNLELEPTDLAALLTQNTALNRVLASKRDIRLELEVAADLPTMELDAAKIEQVLNNLLSNAVKFSNPGDVVNIRATHGDGRISISVADHGPGIPPNDMGKLFTAFGRTSIRSASGEKDTGLGLLIVKRILEAHHGGIRVESEPGKGTTFVVTLPTARSAPAPESRPR